MLFGKCFFGNAFLKNAFFKSLFLNPLRFNPFPIVLDRTLTLFFNGSQSLYVDGLAWTATQTSTWLPLAVILFYVFLRNNTLSGTARIVLSFALCILLADQVASSLFKPMVARWRPTNNPEFMYMVDVVRSYRGGNYGFFSSHAANTMAVATFVALLLKSRSVTYWLYSWVILNCWTRVYLGVHYIGDLTVGCIWGALVGWGIYRLLIEKWQKQNLQNGSMFVSSCTTATGYTQRSLHIFIASILITYLFIAFKALSFQG